MADPIPSELKEAYYKAKMRDNPRYIAIEKDLPLPPKRKRRGRKPKP